jgi:hypothetical protein
LVFLFSADRHLSELTPANEHDRCLLNFPKEARSIAAALINPMIWIGLFLREDASPYRDCPTIQ